VDRPLRVLVYSENPDFRARAQRNLLKLGATESVELEFFLDPSHEVDVVIVLDPLRESQTFLCRDGFLWFWQLEANLRVDYLGGYDRIFGQRDVVGEFGGEAMPPMTDWLVEKTYDALWEEGVPNKTRGISLVSSRKSHLPGHRTRNQTFDLLEKEISDLDVFGPEKKWVADKWDTLAPYRYSVVVENTSSADYITEKLVDCFLTYTLPIYFGAPNILDYYPKDSVVILPSLDPQSVVSVVRSVLEEDPWESRVHSLSLARETFLEKYSIRGMVTALISAQRQEILGARLSRRKIFGLKTMGLNVDYHSSRLLRHNFARARRHFFARLAAKV